MADDEKIMSEGSEPDEAEEADEAEDDDLEEGPDADDLDDEEAFEDLDEDETVEEDEDDEEEEDEDDEVVTARAKRRAGEEEEDEDDELLSPDDVEADLDRILKDRLVTADEDEDEDEEEEEPEDRADGGDRLQPKRADEQLCPQCFLLVRASAPACPVGDDACPIFG
jgi:hypothetical protein